MTPEREQELRQQIAEAIRGDGRHPERRDLSSVESIADAVLPIVRAVVATEAARHDGATVLNTAERELLSFALMRAEEAMYARGAMFLEEDAEALDSLRRMAADPARQGEPAPSTTPVKEA